MPASVKVLLVNPDVSVRSSLARLLEGEPGLLVSERPGNSSPDVVLVQASSREGLEQVRERYPNSRIVAWVSVLGPDLRDCPGVDRVLDSIAPYEQILRAIRELTPP